MEPSFTSSPLTEATLSYLHSDVPDEAITLRRDSLRLSIEAPSLREILSALSAEVDRETLPLGAVAFLLNELLSFRRQLQTHGNSELYPCWQFADDEIPVDLSKLDQSYSQFYWHGYWPPDVWRDLGEQSLLRRWDEFIHFHDRNAEDLAGNRPSLASVMVVSEMFARLFSRSLVSVAQSVKIQTRHFTVQSQNSGYRVHWTHQFWMSPVVFGAPSTPVTGYLTDGLYRFGGDKVGGPLVWDSGIHPADNHNRAANITAF